MNPKINQLPHFSSALCRTIGTAFTVWDYGMAKAFEVVVEGVSLLTSAATGDAGFCFSSGAGGGVCGWVFLAWVSALLSEAEAECQVLAGEGCGEPGTGSAGDEAAAQAGLERVPDLGVSIEEIAGSLCAADTEARA